MRLSMTSLLMIMIHTYPLFLNTDAQIQYPQVSCPNIFQYSYDRNMGGYFGLVTVQRDGSSTSELQVNMSTNTQQPLTSNIKITVLSKQEEIFNGNEIKYTIQFPLQDVLPKLTLIQFNGKVLCRGDPDPLEPGIIQTSMWAKSIVTTFSGSDKNQPTTQKPANLYANSGFFFSIGAPGQRPFEYPNNPFIPETTTTIRNEIHPIQQPTTITTSTTTTTSVRPTTITTTKAPKTIDQCGVTKVSVLIIGGDGIAPGDFPWLAAIMYRQKSDYKFHCTGNLVSNKHVLTAGHCVRYHKAPLFENDDLIIVLGKLNIENWANGGTIRNAKRVISHPNYKQDTADYDIAIIVLSELVRFKPGIRPICLWERSDNLEDIVGTFGTVVGWGKQKESGDSSSLAQKIEMPVVSQENCLWSNKVFNKYTSSRTFCAGNRDKVTGPCAGDSGAGFMIKDEASKKWFLRGLVGFSIRDPQTLSCDLSSYVVFIDIAKVRDWIQEEMKADLDD